jgi:metal-responsive CopG/Arc/MetJ family transcriptional regulator
MRTTTNISITLTPEMLDSAQKIAKAENRTMSELVREALRRYEKERRWEAIKEYRKNAEQHGIREEDVVRIIREERTKKKNNQSVL